MRSGPSARRTSCHFFRQRKRAGGPSGAKARTSTGCGGSNRVNGRVGGWPGSGAGQGADLAETRHGGGNGGAFALRLIGIEMDKTQHALAAETRRQAVEQFAQFLFRVLRRRAGKIGLRRFKIFRAGNGETQGVEAETGIERIGQCVELFAKQTGTGFAGRASGARFLRAGGEQNRRRGKIRLRKRGRPVPVSPADWRFPASSPARRFRWIQHASGARRNAVRPCNRAAGARDLCACLRGRTAARFSGKNRRRNARRKDAKTAPPHRRAFSIRPAARPANAPHPTPAPPAANARRRLLPPRAKKRRRRKNAPARGRNPAFRPQRPGRKIQLSPCPAARGR